MEALDMKKKITIMVAVMATLLFVALNQTIVGTALPRIVGDIGGIHYFNWVFTIYMLASSVTAILVGKLSDIYGRKPFILIGLGIFTLGSFLNGLAGTIFQLIAFRAVQGFGAGMIMSTAFSSIGDLFPPRERGRWQGLMAASFGVASVFGPTLGGYIVDQFHWHWVFWVFLPFGLVAFTLIGWLFPKTEQNRSEPIDFMGAFFLAATIVPLLLAFSWGGTDYAWRSVQIIGLFVMTVIAFVLFIIVERKVASPILPLRLFRNNVFTISNAVGFLLGFGMFGAIMYMPFFIQGVMGRSATVAGFMMMAMTLSNVMCSAISGQIMTKTGKYKVLALIGLTIMGTGLFLSAMLTATSAVWHVLVSMIIVGMGLGTCFPIFTLTVQNAVAHRHLGVATSSAQLFRQLGGTIGVSMMGTMMNVLMGKRMNGLAAVVPEIQNEDQTGKLEALKDPQILMEPGELAHIRAGLPEDIQSFFGQIVDYLREALSYGLTGVFMTAGGAIVTAFVLTLFLKEIALRTSNQ